MALRLLSPDTVHLWQVCEEAWQLPVDRQSRLKDPSP